MRWFITNILFFAFTVCYVAQSNDLDSRYTPPAKSVFDMNPSNAGVFAGKSTTNKNFIKLIPTMLARQRVAGIYEREITNSFSAYAGIGKAFGQDVFQNAFLQLFSSFNFEQERLYPDVILSNSKFHASSPIIITGVRLYISDMTFEDSYLDFNYRYEKTGYLLEQQFVKDINYTSSDKIINFRMHALNFGYGFTRLFGEKKNFSSEFFFSVGMKYFLYDEVVEKEGVLPPGWIGSYRYHEKSGKFAVSRIIPAINIGYCFGFGF